VRDPYQQLGISREADDEAVHAAYHARLKLSPPEHDPEGFRRLREAYELLKTERLRVAFDLFHVITPDREALLERIVSPRQSPRRPSMETLRSLLREGEK